MRNKLHLLLMLATTLSALSFPANDAFGQGTAIGYQGRLQDNSQPATGLYDFTFTVFDAETDGAALAAALAMDAVPVTNGLFNVSLDFGPGIFAGAARWLEITVRTNGPGVSTLLAPRTSLLPAPYSIFAGTAGSVTSGALTPEQLSAAALPAPGQFLSYDGASFLWSDPAVAGGSIWSLNGVNTYYNAGSVGIGTDTPSTGVRLEVNGPARVTPGGAGGFVQIGTPSGETGLSILGENRMDLRFDGSMAKLVAGLGLGAPPANNGLAVTTSGLVGIGTTTPLARLHVKDPFDSVTQLLETDGGINAWAKLAFKNLAGEWHAGTSRGFNNNAFYIDRIGTAGLEFQLATSGHLGLGIEPQAKLHLYDPNASVSHRIETGGGDNAWTRIEFANGNGQWHIGTSRGYNGDQFFIHRLGPAQSPFALDGNGFAARFTTADLYLGHVSRRGTPGRALVDFGTNLVVNFGDDWSTTVIGGAVTEVKALRITGGADVAEPFHMPETIDKGSVVIIDEANPGHLKMSSEAYDTRVAGIVSGANGINPGLALHQEGALEGGQNVALSGRVYVHADATLGAIRPGDLLTTSTTPGHAMKVTDHARAQGAILGKAMTPLKEGRGMVLVLVTLQ